MRVGDHPGLTLRDFQDEYLALRPTQNDSPIRILEEWVCPCCHSANWAEIVYANGEIVRIMPILLTRQALDHSHFLSERVYERFGELTGQSMYEAGKARSDFLPMLREYLPDAESST